MAEDALVKKKMFVSYTYRNPSNPSSLPLIWMGMARAYAFATRRLRYITMSLAQISSSIWCHLSSTSWMWSCVGEKKTKQLESWFKEHIPNYYIFVDPEYNGCVELTDWKKAADAIVTEKVY